MSDCSTNAWLVGQSGRELSHGCGCGTHTDASRPCVPEKANDRQVGNPQLDRAKSSGNAGFGGSEASETGMYSCNRSRNFDELADVARGMLCALGDCQRSGWLPSGHYVAEMRERLEELGVLE